MGLLAVANLAVSKSGMWGRGDSGTWLRIFTIFSTFHRISQNPRLLIVTALYSGFIFLVCTMRNKGIVNIYSIVYYSSS